MAPQQRIGEKKKPAKKLSAGELASELAAVGREFHFRSWALGTSGNYSAVLNHEPLRLLITSSGLDKSKLTPRGFLELNADGKVTRGNGKPSAEAMLHVAIARARGAGSILHTHSVWSTILSDLHAAEGGLAIKGYEMLKGLRGIATHQHREWVPIFENSQDIAALAKDAEATLQREKTAHGFLLRGHGMYTWGEDIAEARRHVEILEFLLEVEGRRELAGKHRLNV